MSLNFSPSDKSDESPRRCPPTDYLSRSVQLRLLMLVGALLLVAMFVSRVGDPKFWSLLGFEDRPIAGGAPLTDAEIAHQSVDTQLPDVPPGENDLGVFGDSRRAAAPAALTIPDPTEPPGRWGVADTEAPAELVAASRDAWRQLFSTLDGDQQLLFYEALDARRGGRRLPASDAEVWTKLLVKLGLEWKAYAVGALESLTTLPEDEQTLWRKRLASLHSRWPEYWNPLLSAWVGEGPAPREDPALLDRLQQHLDDVVAGTIRDNTMARAAEKAAWFRWLVRLRDTPPDDLRAQSLGPTGYLPLFKQARDYRGKVVTVRGVVHLAYHVAAPPNRTGISGYYLFWLRPAGGPNSPIVVYSLETPPGFPPIKDKYVDGEMTTLNEEVEFTGYFFKRWAYQTAQDIQVAPLVLARGPRWQPSAVVEANGPGWLTVVLIVFVSAFLGIGIALIALRRDPGPRRQPREPHPAHPTASHSPSEEQRHVD